MAFDDGPITSPPLWHSAAAPGTSEAPDTERPSETARTPWRPILKVAKIGLDKLHNVWMNGSRGW